MTSDEWTQDFRCEELQLQAIAPEGLSTNRYVNIFTVRNRQWLYWGQQGTTTWAQEVYTRHLAGIVTLSRAVWSEAMTWSQWLRLFIHKWQIMTSNSKGHTDDQARCCRKHFTNGELWHRHCAIDETQTERLFWMMRYEIIVNRPLTMSMFPYNQVTCKLVICFCSRIRDIHFGKN